MYKTYSMVDFFTSIYPSKSVKKGGVLNSLRVYSAIRFAVRSTANAVLPLYFKFTAKNSKYRLNNNENNKPKLIVSLTSFPARINNVHLVVESILRQSVLPDKIILWLSEEQFKSIDDVPLQLKKLQERGLEIKLREGDIRSFKKYYYTVEDFPNSDFIIIDDDTFYPSTLIENLHEYSKKYPETVCFNRGYQLKLENGRISPYNEWRVLEKEIGPRYDLMATGVGGVYYPAKVLHKMVLDKDAFLNHCRLADDIWLYAMTLYNGKKLLKTDENRIFLPVLNKNDITLTSVNVGQNRNDLQLDSLIRYFKSNSMNVFNRLFEEK